MRNLFRTFYKESGLYFPFINCLPSVTVTCIKTRLCARPILYICLWSTSPVLHVGPHCMMITLSIVLQGVAIYENAWALTYLPRSSHAQSFCPIALLPWWTKNFVGHVRHIWRSLITKGAIINYHHVRVNDKKSHPHQKERPQYECPPPITYESVHIFTLRMVSSLYQDYVRNRPGFVFHWRDNNQDSRPYVGDFWHNVSHPVIDWTYLIQVGSIHVNRLNRGTLKQVLRRKTFVSVIPKVGLADNRHVHLFVRLVGRSFGWSVGWLVQQQSSAKFLRPVLPRGGSLE